MIRLFVYGTLKRGCKNHHLIAGESFVGEARTSPGFRLYHLGDFPGMVADDGDTEGVTGEVWAVDELQLARLDAFEGVAEGLYRREPVPLMTPFETGTVYSYLYARSVDGCRTLGPTWAE